MISAPKILNTSRTSLKRHSFPTITTSEQLIVIFLSLSSIEDHIEAVKNFWLRLRARGYIIEGVH